LEKGASARFTDKVLIRSGHCILEEPSRVYVGLKKKFFTNWKWFQCQFH